MSNAGELAIPLGNLLDPYIDNQVVAANPQHNLSKLRFWREFSAGMKMLTLHLGRNNANQRAIILRNLKLLHGSLKTEKIYQQLLCELPSQPPGSWTTIANSGRMHCGLVNIVASQNTPLQGIFDQIETPTTNENLSDSKGLPQKPLVKQGLVALYIVEGKLQINSNSKNHSQKTSRPLRPGNGSLHSINSLAEQLNSVTPNCQLLILALPLSTQD